MADFTFGDSKITADGDSSHEIKKKRKKKYTRWKKSYDKPRQHIKKQRYHFANKGPSSQCYGFPSTHLQMRELDHKKRRSAEEWMLSTEVLEKTLEVLLDHEAIQPVHPKGNQS